MNLPPKAFFGHFVFEILKLCVDYRLLKPVDVERRFESGCKLRKYCGAKGNWPANWPDGNWPDGNWEELPIEFCEDASDGFEDDD
ncbi:hypothetical protein Tco_0906074 [Tanacetum coccineum]